MLEEVKNESRHAIEAARRFGVLGLGCAFCNNSAASLFCTFSAE